MLLQLQHADLVQRDCKDCWVHVYNERSGEKEVRRGKPVERPPGTSPPCIYNRCKKGSPDAFQVLLPQNWEAYDHYMGCKATGRFPDDPIVQRNAKIISHIESEMEKLRQHQTAMLSQLKGIA